MRSAGGPRWPAGRRLLGAITVGLVSLPLMGLNGWFGIGVTLALVLGVATVAWLLWNLFVARQPEFQWTSLYGLFVPLGLIALGYAWLAEALGRKPAMSSSSRSRPTTAGPGVPTSGSC
jgi:cytochrome bd-type quinol oxidase subunit 1